MGSTKTRPWARISAAMTGVVATTIAGMAMNPAPASAATSGTCTTMTLPVALASGGPADQSVFAEYCVPGRPVATVDVLVPGATYNHDYWDWPQDPRHYSYTDKTLAAGRAIFTYDLVGSGESSHPASTSLTVITAAYVLHQLIGWVREQGYQYVDVIGHSMGSIVAMQDAGMWPSDPSRLVVTGLVHQFTAGGAASPAAYFYPAADDPAFVGSGLDPGYLTTLPGVRAKLFYDHADPAVVAYDEAHKDVVSATEFGSALAMVFAPPGAGVSDSITAPVLAIVGQEDYLLCVGGAVDCASPSAIQAHEAPYYTSAAGLTTESVPATGHDLAFSPTAEVSFQMINSWLERTSPQ